MSLRIVLILGSVCSALAVSGCAYGEVRQVVRAQFASELDCPEVMIKKRDAWYGEESPNQWKVSGCGVMRTYTCPKTEGRISYDQPACTWVEGDADAPKMHAPKPDDAMDDSEELGDEPPMDDEAGGDEAKPDDAIEGEGGGADEADDDSAGPQGKAGTSKKAAGASGSAGVRINTSKKK